MDVKLIVELDGGQHSEEADAKRTAFLETNGYRILRFWNSDVMNNTEAVLQVIWSALKERDEK